MGAVCDCSAPKSDQLLAQKASANTIARVKLNPLDNDVLKTKAMALCKEHTELDVHGDDVGFATFLEKYLPEHTDTIFAKLSIDDISNEKQLREVLTLCILFYKVQVFRIKVQVFSSHRTKTKFKKGGIKPIARYLSAWIVATCGDGDDEEEVKEQEDAAVAGDVMAPVWVNRS